MVGTKSKFNLIIFSDIIILLENKSSVSLYCVNLANVTLKPFYLHFKKDIV